MDKNSIIINSVVAGVSYIGLSNVSTALNQAINNQFSLEKIPLYLQSNILSPPTYINLFDFNSPVSVAGLGAFAWITYKILALKNKTHKEFEQGYDYGSHGTSRFQTEQEIKKKYYRDKFGWFLGTVDLEKTINKDKLLPSRETKPYTYKENMDGAYHKINGELNMQTLVLGPPGSKKTTGFVLPNIFHIVNMYKDKEEKADIIITDPKSELFENTAELQQALTEYRKMKEEAGY